MLACIIFLKIMSTFLKSRNRKFPSFLTCQEFNYPFVLKCSFKTLEKRHILDDLKSLHTNFKQLDYELEISSAS